MIDTITQAAEVAQNATSLTISRTDIGIVLTWFTVVGGALVKWLMSKSDKATDMLTESVKNQTDFMRGWGEHKNELRDGLDEVKKQNAAILERLPK